MKILQINSVCGYGSTGRIATDIYKILEEKGHECLIAYGRGTAPKGINSIKIGTNFDNYMHVTKTRLLDKHGFGSTKVTKEFIKKAKEYDPDVIHLHNIHGYYINIELLFNYLKEANKPVVWTLHDCWTFTGHCAYFDYIGCDKWKVGCDRCSERNAYPRSLFIDNSKYNYERKEGLFTGIKNMTIVTPSKWLAGLVKQSFFSKYDVKVINNGIDLDVFKPTKSDFRKKYNLEKKFIILGVASMWDERKGLKYFLELSKCIDSNYKVVLVGLNDKQLNQLPQNIIGIKRTNSVEELAEIYSVADVFVNMSSEETFGLVTAEAMACGTPAVSINSTANPELLTDSCGFVSKKNDIRDMYNYICEVKSKGKIKYQISCINHVKQCFDKKVKYMEYLSLFESLCNKSL